jgi:epoxyqueuosine reductase QueG
MAIDTWYYFMANEPYPKDFWSKSEKVTSELSEKEFKMLLKHLSIKREDIEYLIRNYPDFLKEELEYLKKREKEKSKN